MPGILPMKVIRIGNNSQSRIAQACDRCRSKKIRCDGIRPCCTQCANVGFECKTSDKLSRRAFPRGYTESLEDRVRGLEAEVRELKDLLDEKDEKIDMLSRIHNFSPSSRKSSSCLSPGISAQVKAELESAREDALHVETAVPAEPATPSLGSSSMAAFMTAFDDKVQESGRQVPNILPMAFAPQAPPVSPVSPRESSKIPPRLLSDQYINLFFQEWQPLLPIFHRPTFLRVYEQYLLDPEARQWHSNKQAIAQLYLVFDISAQSSTSRSKQSVTSHEPQWRKALHSISANASLSTLQCHVLAELYYLLKADYAHLARHRAIAVSMCHQLGLHQCQNYPSLPVLEAETRKKVFWCQYVLDKFTSAATGTPMLFREADITTEYPADVDDENVSIQGFSPTLPGEITKLSSALALFKASRILSKTLEQLYPAKASYQLSLTKLHAISDELDQWSTNLPAHLRLQFCKDKPSTNVISCRSPLLFLAYFYIRSLIHRPIVCHGSGSTASASTIVLAAAAKHVVQIFDLLDERRLNYTFPLNKTEFLLSSGFSLLWQCLDLEPHSKLVMDNQKSLTMLIDILSRDSQTAGCEFLRVASSFVTIGSTGRQQQITTQAPRRIDTDASASRKSVSLMPAPPEKQKSTRKQLQAIASRLSAFGNKKPDDAAGRRATVPREAPSTSVSPHPHHRAYSSVSVSSTRSAPVMPMCSPVPARLTQSRTIDLPSNVNLDYFPIGEEDSHTHSSSTTTLANKHIPDHGMGDTSWEQLLTNIDNSSMYSGIYTNHTNGSVSPNGVHKAASSMSGSQEWATPSTDETWPSLSAIDLSLPSKDAVPQSVLSFSEESLTSQEEDLVFSVASSNNGSTATSDSLDAHDQGLSAFKGIAMPTVDDEFDFHDLDGSY